MRELCRDCDALFAQSLDARCPSCGSPRLVRHEALDRLAIAHVDGDAFYAAVEKRDRPELADRPVIVGGGARGVVLAACYVARLSGVRSAMPMAKALSLCPDAVVIRPEMGKYRAAGLELREEMRRLTPLVEPISIDEAFLDLQASDRGGRAPAQLLSRLARRVEERLGITVSIGLSDNKFLAKLASDLDKPRGFAVLCREEAPAFLAGKPVSLIHGVGRALERRLALDGITLIGQLAAAGERELASRYGRLGARLFRLAQGEDDRPIEPHAARRSISAETTLETDEADRRALERALLPLCERVSSRLKEAGLAASAITLKLKTSRFRVKTRSRRLFDPTQSAQTLFRAGAALLGEEADGVTRFRLIGIGADGLVDARAADLPTLFDERRRAPA